MKNNKYINIANTLTLSRVFLGIIFFILFLYAKSNNLSNINILLINAISILIFIIAIITDGLDGYFARRNNNVTNFGKHFDPFADSIFFIIVFFTFVTLKLMPIYFFVIITSRELFMHLFLRPYFKSKGEYLPANIFGKIKTVIQCVFSLIILTGLLLQQILFMLSAETTFIQKYSYSIIIASYIFFAIITFLSLFSLSTYLAHFKKKFLNKTS